MLQCQFIDFETSSQCPKEGTYLAIWLAIGLRESFWCEEHKLEGFMRLTAPQT